MINAKIFRNKNGEVYGLEIENHTNDIVCAAVSILTLNLANSIEAFTDEEFVLDYDDKGGYFYLEVPTIKKNSHNHDINLLFNSLILGLNGIKEQYKKNICIIDKEV